MTVEDTQRSPLFDPIVTDGLCVLVTSKALARHPPTTPQTRLDAAAARTVEEAALAVYHLVPMVSVGADEIPYFGAFCTAAADKAGPAFKRATGSLRTEFGLGRDTTPEIPCVVCYRATMPLSPFQLARTSDPSLGGVVLLKGGAGAEEIIDLVHSFQQR